MVSREEVLSWLLEYSCRYQHYGIVSEIIQHHSGLLKCPHLCVSCAMLQRIVFKSEVSSYPEAIKHLDYIHQSCGKVVPFMIYAKLVTGLKEKVLLNILKKNEEDLWTELTCYFPKNGTQYDGVNKSALAKVHSAEKDFRRFILNLYFDSDGRSLYFEKEYEEEYGETFQTALQKLVTIVADKLYGSMSPCIIDKILTNGLEKYKPLSESCGTFKVLSDGLRSRSNRFGIEAADTRPDEEVLWNILQKLTRPESDNMECQSHSLGISESLSRRNSSSLFSSESIREKNSSDTKDSDQKCPATCLKTGTSCSSGNRPCSPVKHRTSAIETFSDFNNKRHLFHTKSICSDGNEGKHSDQKKDNSSETCQNREEIVISSDKSVKSSSESVSLLKIRKINRRDCPNYSDNENSWQESQGSRGSDNVEASNVLITEENSGACVEDTTSHTQQSEMESGSRCSVEKVTIFTNIISNKSEPPESRLPHSSVIILDDNSQEAVDHAIVQNKLSSQAAKKNCLNRTKFSHKKKDKLVKEKVTNETALHKQIDLAVEKHGCAESSLDDDLILETSETIFSFHENLDVTSMGSISDINDIESEDEIVPPSCADELEFWDIFSTEDDTNEDQFPLIFTHRSYSNTKLCIVKLYRNKVLDVDGGVGMFYQMYS